MTVRRVDGREDDAVGAVQQTARLQSVRKRELVLAFVRRRLNGREEVLQLPHCKLVLELNPEKVLVKGDRRKPRRQHLVAHRPEPRRERLCRDILLVHYAGIVDQVAQRGASGGQVGVFDELAV